MRVRHERMSAEFEKWLFTYRQRDRRYFHTVLHHFTGRDTGHPHSHPWNFTSHILSGSYVERVYAIHPDGSWSSSVVHRAMNTVHNVTAKTIHEIIELPEGECWTAVVPTSAVPVPWHFWQFTDNGIFRRLPRERKFRKLQTLSEVEE